MHTHCSFARAIVAPMIVGGILLAGVVSALAQEPLRIAKQGSIEAGGDVVVCMTNDGGDPRSQRWPPGRVVINHVYATYQYPANQTYKYPILFNPGGGHSARVYDTTPDGREGWLTLFPREGFAVYGVDRVNTGRSAKSSRSSTDEVPSYPRVRTSVEVWMSSRSSALSRTILQW